MPEILNFFPLTVYVNQLGFSANERKEMVRLIVGDAEGNTPKTKSKTSAWTGDVNGFAFLHERPEFEKLFTAIDQNLNQYLEELGAVSKLVDFYFTRSWGIVQKKGEKVAFHTHMQSHISAVYYPVVPENSGMLMFDMNPNSNEFIPGLIRPQHVEKGYIRPSPLLAQNMNIGVREDMLVIFPSKTNHATQANTTGQTRVSISSDIVCTVKDPAGHEFFLPPLERWRKF